jgi:polyisoprenoid-binding protein YceI
LPATRYRIVPEQSKVWIDARSNVHPIHSSTDGIDGYIALAFNENGEVDLSVEPAGELSFPVSRLRSGNPLEHRELQRRIDARRFPTIDGVLTKMEKVDGDDRRHRVTGDLTFRGVTRTCDDEMTVDVVDDATIRLTGASTFDVRDFGMEPPRILVLHVEPQVDVRVDILARRDT